MGKSSLGAREKEGGVWFVGYAARSKRKEGCAWVGINGTSLNLGLEHYNWVAGERPAYRKDDKYWEKGGGLPRKKAATFVPRSGLGLEKKRKACARV